MRSSQLRMAGLALLVLVVMPSPAAAAPTTLDRIDAALAAGTITFDTAARERIFGLFEPGRVDPAFRAGADLPAKGATLILHELALRAAELRPETRALLAAYVGRSDPQNHALLAAYDTPGGHFRLSYQTAGQHAVPPGDVNPANGIPDYVERVGEYCETSWTVEITDLGYPAPPIGAGRYSITLEDLGTGFYGYTTVVGGQLTRIVMDNDFVGFPPNSDPDGSALGAAKVTAAHEFKHASQYVGSGWSEGDWVELDATWVEDQVFDQTNDYYNYLGQSQIRYPAAAMNPGSYEDCIWQHYMSEKYGLQFVYDVWHRRDLFPGEAMLTTYSIIFGNYSSSLAGGFGEYLTWALQCGSRANAQDPGFQEAASYPSALPSPTHFVYPVTNGTSTASGMGGRYIAFASLPNTQEVLRINLNGQNGVPFRAHVIWATDAGVYGMQQMVLDANGDGEVTSPPVADLAAVYMVAGNGSTAGSGSFTYTANLIQAAAIAGDGGEAPARAARLVGAEPNPFNPATTIRYALGERGFVSLAVHDVEGQVVRVLVERAEEAGEHAVAWDGRDGRGRAAASGAYFVRMAVPGRAEVQKITLVK